ncbi:hypothetical protein CRG98_049896, partial [Punica granatum]
KGALGRGKGRLGRTGPRVWIRLFQANFGVRPNGSGDKLGRVVSDGLNWAERARPAQTQGKWAEPVRDKMNGEDEDGRRGGFRQLRTAVPASGCRGDGARGRERRQRAPPWLHRARDGRHGSRDSLGREDFLNFPARFLDFPAKDFRVFRRKSVELRGRNGGVLFRGVSPVRFRGEIGARGRDSEHFSEIRESGALSSRES